MQEVCWNGRPVPCDRGRCFVSFNYDYELHLIVNEQGQDFASNMICPSSSTLFRFGIYLESRRWMRIAPGSTGAASLRSRFRAGQHPASGGRIIQSRLQRSASPGIFCSGGRALADGACVFEDMIRVQGLRICRRRRNRSRRRLM
jgi:hypothetical protein